MKQNRKRDFFVILAVVAAWATTPLVILVETILEDMLHLIALGAPLTEYLLFGYLSPVVAGIVMARSPSTDRIIQAAVAGTLYALGKTIYWAIFPVFFQGSGIGSLIWFRLNFLVLCAILAAGSCAVFRRRHNNA